MNRKCPHGRGERPIEVACPFESVKVGKLTCRSFASIAKREAGSTMVAPLYSGIGKSLALRQLTVFTADDMNEGLKQATDPISKRNEDHQDIRKEQVDQRPLRIGIEEGAQVRPEGDAEHQDKTAEDA